MNEEPRPVARVVRAGRRPLILVCGKCLKRHGEGKAVRRALKEAARDSRPRLVRSACLGLCPKRLVVAASAATLSRGEVVLIAGPGDAAAAAAVLLPGGTDSGVAGPPSTP
jgi:hypothetical protein